MNFTIERAHTIDNEFYTFLCAQIETGNGMFEGAIDFSKFDVFAYAANHFIWVAKRDGRIVGWMFAQICSSVFDPDVKMLIQDSLYVEKSSHRAAYLLLRAFIDFGRANAKMIFTCRTKYTNVKARSFERLGFEKTEEVFRLIVGD